MTSTDHRPPLPAVYPPQHDDKRSGGTMSQEGSGMEITLVLAVASGMGRALDGR